MHICFHLLYNLALLDMMTGNMESFTVYRGISSGAILSTDENEAGS